MQAGSEALQHRAGGEVLAGDHLQPGRLALLFSAHHREQLRVKRLQVLVHHGRGEGGGVAVHLDAEDVALVCCKQQK